MMQAGLVAEFVVDYCSVMLECISRGTVSCAAASRMTSGDRRDPVCVCGTPRSLSYYLHCVFWMISDRAMSVARPRAVRERWYDLPSHS